MASLIRTSSEDWTKRTWDLPTTFRGLVMTLGVDLYNMPPGKPLEAWKVLKKFQHLPSYRACPDALKLEIEEYLGQRPPLEKFNPHHDQQGQFASADGEGASQEDSWSTTHVGGGVSGEGPDPTMPGAGQVRMTELPKIPGWKRTTEKRMTVQEYCDLTNVDYKALRLHRNAFMLDAITDAIPKTPSLTYSATINGTNFDVKFGGALDPTHPTYTPEKITTVMQQINELARFAPIPDGSWRTLDWDDPDRLQRNFHIALFDDVNIPSAAAAYNIRGGGVVHIQPFVLDYFHDTLGMIIAPTMDFSPAAAVALNPDSWKYILVHEWGHALDALSDAESAENQRTLGKDISTYAMSGSEREANAEAFADCYFAGKNATLSSKTIYRQMGLPESRLQTVPYPEPFNPSPSMPAGGLTQSMSGQGIVDTILGDLGIS